jgi:uncharacterized protein (TIGR00369 family)
MEIPELPIRVEAGFDGLYGLEITKVEDGYVEGRVVVEEKHKQLAGLVHGGLYAAMAESLASVGTFWAVAPERNAQGLANQTSFLRPVLEGSVRAVCRARHRGRTTWVWEVDFLDDQDRLCALTRMTIAVREPRPA